MKIRTSQKGGSKGCHIDNTDDKDNTDYSDNTEEGEREERDTLKTPVESMIFLAQHPSVTVVSSHVSANIETLIKKPHIRIMRCEEHFPLFINKMNQIPTTPLQPLQLRQPHPSVMRETMAGINKECPANIDDQGLVVR